MSRYYLIAALLTFGSPAIAGVPVPSPDPLLFGNESAAHPDGPAALLFNPASLGVRYPAEFAITRLDVRGDRPAYRGVLAGTAWSLSASGRSGAKTTLGFGSAGGSDRLRLGTAISWVPDEGGRTADWRIGALSRATPWLSLGAVLDHASRPNIDGVRLQRDYTVGLGLRPFALSRGSAHTLGTRLTLTVDARKREDQGTDDAEYRVGGEWEVVPGISARGLYFTEQRGFQVGVSVLDVRAAYHAQSGYDRGGIPRYVSHNLSFHAGEDRTVVTGPNKLRVAVVPVGGDLGDESLSGFTLFGTVHTAPTTLIHRQLETAREDPLTRGVLLDLRGSSGMAQLEELRTRVSRIRAAGKPVVAFLEGGGRRGDFYLASACDRIVTTPEAFFPGLGLRVERRYYRKLLDDWGVRIDRTSYGKYKSAYRSYSVDSTPAPDREAIEHTLDTVQDLFVGTVSADRRMERQRLLTLFDGRRWPPEELRKAGLVDSIGYREDALRILGSLAHLGPKPRAYLLSRRMEARREWTVPTRVAVVYASGAIESGTSGNDLLLGPYMGSETMTLQIESAFRNRDVRAVVLRVESPGGSSVASDIIHHATVRMKRETRKPLVVSMGGVAASGGYHIAAPADRIFADRFTATGSIGVLFVRPSFERWYAQHDVRQDAFERGRYMRAWSGGRDWDREIQASADSATYAEYRDFVATVADDRKLTWDEVDQAAQGRVWLGEDARQRKLVDEIGGLDDAITEARRLGKIPEGEKIRTAEYRRPRPNLFQRLVGTWVREVWERSVGMPDPGEMLYWMDDEALP